MIKLLFIFSIQKKAETIKKSNPDQWPIIKSPKNVSFSRRRVLIVTLNSVEARIWKAHVFPLHLLQYVRILNVKWHRV